MGRFRRSLTRPSWRHGRAGMGTVVADGDRKAGVTWTRRGPDGEKRACLCAKRPLDRRTPAEVRRDAAASVQLNAR